MSEQVRESDAEQQMDAPTRNRLGKLWYLIGLAWQCGDIMVSDIGCEGGAGQSVTDNPCHQLPYGMMCIFCVRIFKAGNFPLNSVSRHQKTVQKPVLSTIAVGQGSVL